MFSTKQPVDAFAQSVKTFTQAAETFMQTVNFSEEESPWAMVLMNTLGRMISAYQEEPSEKYKFILSNFILKDLSYILTEGKYADQQHCKEFAAAIDTFVGMLDRQQHTMKTEAEAPGICHIM